MGISGAMPLLGGCAQEGRDLKAVSLLPSLQLCFNKHLCAHLCQAKPERQPSTAPATGWIMLMPSENTFWGIFKCIVRHKFFWQQTVQDKDEIFTFCFVLNLFYTLLRQCQNSPFICYYYLEISFCCKAIMAKHKTESSSIPVRLMI